MSGVHRVPGGKAVLSRALDGGERVQGQDEENLYKTSDFMKSVGYLGLVTSPCWLQAPGGT